MERIIRNCAINYLPKIPISHLGWYIIIHKYNKWKFPICDDNIPSKSKRSSLKNPLPDMTISSFEFLLRPVQESPKTLQALANAAISVFFFSAIACPKW